MRSKGPPRRHPLTFTATASDPASDDLTFDLVATVYNDGFGPDPYPRPAVNSITATAVTTDAYAAAGTYTLTITARDDDGGSATYTVPVTVG